jgi:putative pyruvate formate lyase activating enzyme
MTVASYTYLSPDQWASKVASAEALAAPCRLCPRRCGVNRSAGETGFCNAPGQMIISSIFPHHGEEPPISGTGGSGTVFFSHCTLRCEFCQNYQISWEAEGRPYTPAELAERMLWLQQTGCHNVNLVTPDHYLPWILQALRDAAGAGLTIPVVYNCSGYESPDALDILDSVVDIYLPDMKYGDNGPASSYSHAPDYVEVNQKAIRGMFRQVGALKLDDDGIAVRGLCIRHLVLPNGQSHSENVAEFLASAFDPADIYVSLMAQYRPLHRACRHRDIDRPVSAAEYEPVRRLFVDKGFAGFYQEIQQLNESFVIDFKKRKNQRLK